MKPTELMINDWVAFQDLDTQETEMHQIEQADFTGSDDFFDRFSPIPITVEIIEGFEKDDQWLQYTFYFDKSRAKSRSMVITPQDEDWSEIELTLYSCVAHITITLNYVHELQHVLRLAGYTDIENNLKITKGGAK